MTAIVGPTASGKTEVAIELAEELGMEILSVDSMLVYRGMDVGTAKPTPGQRARVRHHGLDLAQPQEAFSVARYQACALEAAEEVRSRGSRVLLAGGSGLYFRAVVDRLEFPGTDAGTRAQLEAEAAAIGAAHLHARLGQLDPTAAGKIEPANVRRTVRALEVAAVTGRPFSSYARAWEDYPAHRIRALGIDIAPESLASRIRGRVDRMLQEGFLDEVRGLVERGFGGWLTSTQAIGYAELARHLEGELSLDEAIAGTEKRTRALARRQIAWFRRDPRIRWVHAGPDGAHGALDQLRDGLQP